MHQKYERERERFGKQQSARGKGAGRGEECESEQASKRENASESDIEGGKGELCYIDELLPLPFPLHCRTARLSCAYSPRRDARSVTK